MAMVADDSGNVWLGSYFGGLNRYEAAGETFSRYLKYFNGYADQVAPLYSGMDLRKDF